MTRTHPNAEGTQNLFKQLEHKTINTARHSGQTDEKADDTHARNEPTLSHLKLPSHLQSDTFHKGKSLLVSL